MYWGSSNVYPIYGIELDYNNRLTYTGKAKELIYLHPDQHGWERFGQDHRDDRTKPFIEGAWMTKYKGKYYLQYAAPGTEYNVYANGTYVGDNPLGPFTYAPYNPVSYKPGGFMVGAGHGNTFQDNYGNYWNTGTPWVAVNWNFSARPLFAFPHLPRDPPAARFTQKTRCRRAIGGAVSTDAHRRWIGGSSH